MTTKSLNFLACVTIDMTGNAINYPHGHQNSTSVNYPNERQTAISLNYPHDCRTATFTLYSFRPLDFNFVKILAQASDHPKVYKLTVVTRLEAPINYLA